MPTETIRILVADDNKIARTLLVELLQKRGGWQVCGQAEDGQQAVLKATELKPDIVILDLAMPLMDGISAAREIGKALPSVPIVLFTLHDFRGISLEAKKAGVREVLGKNYPEKLMSLIEEIARNLPPASASANKELLPSVSGPLDCGGTPQVQPDLDSLATDSREPETPTEAS